MAGIYDTLAQVRQDTAGMSADAQKAARGAAAWQKAQAIKAAASAGLGESAVSTVPATSAFGRMAATVPTITRGLGALGKAVPALAAGSAVIGEGLNVAETAAQPGSTGADVATTAAEGVGRLGSMAAGAGLGGAAFGPVGAVVGGGLGYAAPNLVYAARDRILGRTAPVAATGAIPSAPVTTPKAAPAAPELTAPAPVTLAPAPGVEALDNANPIPSGTGVIRNNTTGKVTVLDTRNRGTTAAGPGANPDQFVNRAAPGSLASFFGAAMNQKRLAGQEATATATALKMPEFLKSSAEASAISQRLAMAAKETDPRLKAALLSGTTPPAEEKTTFPIGLQPTEMNAGYGVGARGATLTQVPIKQLPRATIAELQTYAKSKGQTLTPAQLRSMAAAQGITVTD